MKDCPWSGVCLWERGIQEYFGCSALWGRWFMHFGLNLLCACLCVCWFSKADSLTGRCVLHIRFSQNHHWLDWTSCLLSGAAVIGYSSPGGWTTFCNYNWPPVYKWRHCFISLIQTHRSQSLCLICGNSWDDWSFNSTFTASALVSQSNIISSWFSSYCNRLNISGQWRR